MLQLTDNGQRDTGSMQLPQNPLLPGEMQDKPMDESVTKDTVDPWDNFDAQAAFLGPSLWDKRLPYDGQDFKVYSDMIQILTT